MKLIFFVFVFVIFTDGERYRWSSRSREGKRTRTECGERWNKRTCRYLKCKITPCTVIVQFIGAWHRIKLFSLLYKRSWFWSRQSVSICYKMQLIECYSSCDQCGTRGKTSDSPTVKLDTWGELKWLIAFTLFSWRRKTNGNRRKRRGRRRSKERW